MVSLRVAAFALLLGLIACAPVSDVELIPAGYLASKDATVKRPRKARHEVTLDDAAQASGRYASARQAAEQVARDALSLRPLFASFELPWDQTPRAVAAVGTGPSASLLKVSDAIDIPRPRIVPASGYLQCVPFARELSGITLSGNAWTWWDNADGRYARGHRPAPGAVIVFSRSSRLPFGHVAVVTEVLGDREILVSHANWLNEGSIHLDTPVVDVSPNNDWSVVRAWYTPGHSLGLRTYRVSGFVLPAPVQSARARPQL